MKVSVVLPTYNRQDRLRMVLEGLEQQDFLREDFEVLVVVDGSTDGTQAYLQALQTTLPLRFFVQANQGVAAARNLGYARAVGDLVLFLDDDVVPIPALIQEHLRLHAAHDAPVVVIGPMLAPPNFRLSPWVQWEQDRLGEQYRDILAGKWEPTARQFYTGNTSLPRQVLVESGGFDPAFRRAEDVELAYRLASNGLRFLFNPQAVGYHFAERSFASWQATPYAYGRNDVIFACHKGQTWLLPTIFREFYTRHPFIRWLTSVCLCRRAVSSAVIAVLSKCVQLGSPQWLSRLPDLACSAIFNLQYYQGLADELGGREMFFNGLAENRAAFLAVS